MRYEQRLIWVLGITFGFLFFDRNAASFLMPFIARDLSFTNQQVGLIASALSFTWAVSAFLGGALSDLTGRRKAVLLASAIAFSLCSVLSGLAGSFLALFAARFLMGLVEGPFMPVCQSLLASESDDSRRGHNMGVMQNFGSNFLGSFVAPLVLVPIAAHWNWRVAFFLAGVPGLVLAVLIARYVHEPEKKSQPAPGSGRLQPARPAGAARGALLARLAVRARGADLHRLGGERGASAVHGHHPVRDHSGALRRHVDGTHRRCRRGAGRCQRARAR